MDELYRVYYEVHADLLNPVFRLRGKRHRQRVVVLKEYRFWFVRKVNQYYGFPLSELLPYFRQIALRDARFAPPKWRWLMRATA